MSPSAIPHPTPTSDDQLQGPAPGARTSASTTSRLVARILALGSAGVAASVAVHAAWRVRRLRTRGATVRPLTLDVDLPGRFPPRSIVVVGDSAAAGHGLDDPEDALARRVGRGLVELDGRATAVRCLAVDGATTADVLETQLELVRGAELVVVGVGVNDAIDPRRSLSAAAEALRRLVDGVSSHAAPDARVVVLTCPDLSVAPGLPGLLRPFVGARCRTLAAAQHRALAGTGAAAVPVGREVLAPRLFGRDGFHPGAEGHERLAAAVLACLRA